MSATRPRTQNVKGPKRNRDCDLRLTTRDSDKEKGRPMGQPWCDRQLGNPLPDQTWHLAERFCLVSQSLHSLHVIPSRLCALSRQLSDSDETLLSALTDQWTLNTPSLLLVFARTVGKPLHSSLLAP